MSTPHYENLSRQTGADAKKDVRMYRPWDPVTSRWYDLNNQALLNNTPMVYRSPRQDSTRDLHTKINTFEHGFGAIPDQAIVLLHCIKDDTSRLKYEAGDVIPIAIHNNNHARQWFTDTTVNFSISPTYALVIKTTPVVTTGRPEAVLINQLDITLYEWTLTAIKF